MSLPASGDRVLADRYRLEGLVGVGGMAEVYRAVDVRLGRPVAVKVFRPGADAADRRRFETEARTLAGLAHPGLVPVYDAGADGQDPFVVLRLVEGLTLRQLIARGPLPVDRVRRLGARLAEALAYVHERDVVHRDVKPSNILIDGEGEPLLTDFGLARFTGASHLTRSNQMVGTAAYLAPEQVKGEEVGCPADIYALGLVLLECLSGRQEYGGSDVECAVARLHRAPEIPSDLPPDLLRLLLLMTSLAPRRRPTATECARLLGADAPEREALPLLLVEPREEPTAEATEVREPTAVIHRPWLTGKVLTRTAAVAVVVAAGLGWALVDSHIATTSTAPVSGATQTSTGAPSTSSSTLPAPITQAIVPVAAPPATQAPPPAVPVPVPAAATATAAGSAPVARGQAVQPKQQKAAPAAAKKDKGKQASPEPAKKKK